MDDAMTQWGDCEPFGIDRNELDGLSPRQIFVLGYELAVIATKAETLKSAFSCPIQSINKERIEAFLKKRDREFTINWLEADVSETWCHLNVREKPDLQTRG